MKIYILLSHSGDYEDYHVEIIKAYEMKEWAEEQKEILEDIEKEKELHKDEYLWYEPTWYNIEEHELECWDIR